MAVCRAVCSVFVCMYMMPSQQARGTVRGMVAHFGVSGLLSTTVMLKRSVWLFFCKKEHGIISNRERKQVATKL